MPDSSTKKLARTLSLGDLLALSSSSMAPAYSLAAVMGLVVAAAGLGAPLALVVSTIPIALVAVGFMRLTRKIPSAGAVYTWARAAFGDRPSWFTAMILIIGYYFGTIACAFPTGVYTIKLFFPHATATPFVIAVAAVAWTAFSTYFLIIGARPTAKLSLAFLLVELFAMLLIAGIAFAHPYIGTPPSGFAPLGLQLGSFGWGGVFAGALLSLWITAGWEISCYSAEEAKKGGPDAGAGALVGLLGTFAVVIVCEIAYLRIGTVDGFTQHQEDALAYVASRLGGGWISLLMTATVLVSSAAALWTTMQLLSRGVFAMGRDGLLPSKLASVHPKYGSPWFSILIVSVPISVIMLLAGLAASAQETLLSAVGGSSVFLGTTFVITAFACVTLHLRPAPGEALHVWTGIVMPAAGGLGLVALLVFYVATQPHNFQTLVAGGFLFALIFALTAGQWSHNRYTRPITGEEG
jgi:amino acid transporter